MIGLDRETALRQALSALEMRRFDAERKHKRSRSLRTTRLAWQEIRHTTAAILAIREALAMGPELPLEKLTDAELLAALTE